MDAIDKKKFQFTVGLNDLIYAGDMEGFNSILDDRMSEAGLKEMAVDISYTPVALDRDNGVITIEATYTPECEDVPESYEGPVKVWMELETLPKDKDEEPRSLNDEVLPEPLVTFDTVDEAVKFMEHLKQQYYDNKI